MAGKFVLSTTKSGKCRFNLQAGNGRVILASQNYASKASAENGIASVQKNAADDGRYERRKAKDGSPYFVLNASNGQIIGTSEMYSSTSAMEKGIRSVKTNGPTATTDDRI